MTSEPEIFLNNAARFSTALARLLADNGVVRAVISPGSRSTPLACAIAREPRIAAVPVLDERTAAFFALGIAKATAVPVLLVCTSGTAAANYLPAIVEAWHAQVPLLIATADRPPELRDCGAGQTINQRGLYGSHVVFEVELPTPDDAPETLRQWRLLANEALRHAKKTPTGPVHLNVPLREPLAPTNAETGAPFAGVSLTETVTPAVAAHGTSDGCDCATHDTAPASVLREWAAPFARGIIVAGEAQPKAPDAYAAAVLRLAKKLRWPVLADVLNPVRHRANADGVVVSTYEKILAAPERASELRPDAVLQIGQLPAGKKLRAWLGEKVLPTLVVSHGGRNLNPLHDRHQTLDCAVAEFDFDDDTANAEANATNAALWHSAQTAAAAALATELDGIAADNAPDAPLFAGRAAWLLARHLPNDAVVFLANSMVVRDAEHFWPVRNTRRRVFCNRGANGIDGTLGTALGVAEAAGAPVVLLTGDLAFLHDTNALLLANEFSGSLTVALVNNNGGGIFDQLPVARDNAHFERFWGTPQHVSIPRLATAYDVPYEQITTWTQFVRAIEKPPVRGLRILEIHTDRANDARLRTALLAA